MTITKISYLADAINLDYWIAVAQKSQDTKWRLRLVAGTYDDSQRKIIWSGKKIQSLPLEYQSACRVIKIFIAKHQNFCIKISLTSKKSYSGSQEVVLHVPPNTAINSRDYAVVEF